MRKSIACALLLPSSAFACLWIDGTTIDGHSSRISGHFSADSALRAAISTNASEKLEELRRTTQLKRSAAQTQETEAVSKVFSGDLTGAITMLRKLEDASPGQYSTAANLGTAYELSGDNVKALEWINKGIQRNANAHNGTEWLHVLILEAKIEATKHPGQPPVTARLLPVPERMTKDTLISVNGVSRSVGDIQRALDHQLQERLVFVKSNDPYVADLLYSYALIAANLESVEAGLGLLTLARDYGFPDGALLALKADQFSAILTKATQEKARKKGLIKAGCYTVAFLLGIFVIRCIARGRRAAKVRQAAAMQI